MHTPSVPNSCRERYAEFVAACRVARQTSYSLTPGAPPPPFALCFAVFGVQLLRETLFLENHRAEYSKLIRENLASYRAERSKISDLFTLRSVWEEIRRRPSAHGSIAISRI